MFRRHPVWIALLPAVLLVACTVPYRSTPKEQQPPLPASIPVAAPAEPFTVLLPQQDLQLRVEVQDRGAAPVSIDEEWLRDDAQRAIIATYAGKPYVRWEWNDEGLWRLDPKGGGAMLRYLPPTLTDGAVWLQESGGARVWFHLVQQADPCKVPGAPGDSADCWDVTVLNRGEVLVFTFARGVGPIGASAENYRQPAQSFTKKLLQAQPSQLSPEQRAGFIAQMKSPGKPAARVEAAFLTEFKAAMPEAVSRGVLNEIVALIQAGKGTELAQRVDPKGLYILTYAPNGFEGPPGVTLAESKQAIEALFHGAQVKVEGYLLSRLSSGHQVDLVLSSVNSVSIPSSYKDKRRLAVNGLISIRCFSTTDGGWRVTIISVDTGYLREALEDNLYKKWE